MATYVPNATDATEPTASKPVLSAAEEFRTLKASINAMRQWLGRSATAPTVDTLGNPVAAGDFYYNTASRKMFVYSGTVWQDVDKTASIVSITTSAFLEADSADIAVVTPSGNVTFTDTSIANGQSILVLIVNPGSYTATWPAGVKWLNGVTPTLLSTGTTFVELIKISGTLYGVALGGAV